MRTSIYIVLGFAVMGTTPAFAQTPRTNIDNAATFGQTAQAPKPAAPTFVDGAKLGFVDIDRVAALSGEGKAVAAKLQEFRGKKAAEVSERGKQVEALQQKLSQGESVLNDATRTRLQREFQRAHIDFQRFTEDAQSEVQDVQQQLFRSFTARLFPVIGDVAKERNLWAVFSSESALLWYNPALDLSEEVAKRLDLSAATPKR